MNGLQPTWLISETPFIQWHVVDIRPAFIHQPSGTTQAPALAPSNPFSPLQTKWLFPTQALQVLTLAHCPVLTPTCHTFPAGPKWPTPLLTPTSREIVSHPRTTVFLITWLNQIHFFQVPLSNRTFCDQRECSRSLSGTAAGSRRQLWIGAPEMWLMRVKDSIFKFYFTFINLNLNSHSWLVGMYSIEFSSDAFLTLLLWIIYMLTLFSSIIGFIAETLSVIGMIICLSSIPHHYSAISMKSRVSSVLLHTDSLRTSTSAWHTADNNICG